MTVKTLFEKIIDREIPADIVYEDDLALAFKDIQPQAPIHILVIPKKPLISLAHAQEDDRALLGHLLLVTKRLAENLQLSSGYRVIMNTGVDGGQSVFHLHIHLLGGRPLAWPPG